jgi:hypothetical protein
MNRAGAAAGWQQHQRCWQCCGLKGAECAASACKDSCARATVACPTHVAHVGSERRLGVGNAFSLVFAAHCCVQHIAVAPAAIDSVLCGNLTASCVCRQAQHAYWCPVLVKADSKAGTVMQAVRCLVTLQVHSAAFGVVHLPPDASSAGPVVGALPQLHVWSMACGVEGQWAVPGMP